MCLPPPKRPVVIILGSRAGSEQASASRSSVIIARINSKGSPEHRSVGINIGARCTLLEPSRCASRIHNRRNGIWEYLTAIWMPLHYARGFQNHFLDRLVTNQTLESDRGPLASDYTLALPYEVLNQTNAIVPDNIPGTINRCNANCLARLASDSGPQDTSHQGYSIQYSLSSVAASELLCIIQQLCYST